MTSDYLTDWLTKNYEEIKTMCQKITRGHSETDDLLHYSILHFMEHSRAEELARLGQAMRFLSGIMWRSFHSSTSAYHTEYRQKGRVYSGDTPEIESTDYDYEEDLVVTQIQRIIKAMKESGHTETWYRAKLFELWLANPNYSDLSRELGIPRTSISHAVTEAREWIKQELKKSGITWN